MDAPARAGSGSEVQRPFLLPAQTGEVSEALEDFARYSKRADWNRAFKSLQKVLDANPAGLVAGSDGFLLSMRARLMQLLAELPADGREAYRLFYDAEAKKLFEEATAAGVPPKTEEEKLAKLASSYFAATVGDAAADRLGELYFEKGEMGQAIDCWQAVLRYRPDSALDRAGLLTKTAIALARSGRWSEFRGVERVLRERHAGATLTLGGAETDAGATLAELAAAAPPAAQADPAATPDIEFPAAAAPLWQFRYFSEANAKAIATAGTDWGARSSVSLMVPPAVLDEKRVYVNLLGHHFALERASGKLLWRSAKFHDIGTRIQQQRYYVFPEQYGIATAEGRVFCVSRKPQEVGQHGTPFRLYCLNAEDGKQLWGSESVAELRDWSFCGTPLVSDRLYVCAYKPQKASELYALAIQPDTGKPTWTVMIGTHQADQSQMYNQRTAQPALALGEGRIYIDTHNGALVELNADTGNLDWGFLYDSEMVTQQNVWYGGQPATMDTAGAPILAGSRLVFKGMRSTRLYQIELDGPKLGWERPVSKREMLAGLDGERIYLSGDEVTSITRDGDRRLAWSLPVPFATGLIRPVTTHTRVYQFTPRGVYELDKSTGDVLQIFRGADLDLGSQGGALFIAADSFLTVSNVAITAYPVQRPRAAASR